MTIGRPWGMSAIYCTSPEDQFAAETGQHAGLRPGLAIGESRMSTLARTAAAPGNHENGPVIRGYGQGGIATGVAAEGIPLITANTGGMIPS